MVEDLSMCDGIFQRSVRAALRRRPYFEEGLRPYKLMLQPLDLSDSYGPFNLSINVYHHNITGNITMDHFIVSNMHLIVRNPFDVRICSKQNATCAFIGAAREGS